MRYSVANSFQKNGHHADIVYAEGSEIVPRSLPVRYVTAFRHAIRHSHHQCRSTYREGFTLASRAPPSKSSSAYYFDSYSILPLVPAIQAFMRRNCITWDHNRLQLQSLRSNNCCLFVRYMDRGFTPKQFFGLFDGGVQQPADR